MISWFHCFGCVEAAGGAKPLSQWSGIKGNRLEPHGPLRGHASEDPWATNRFPGMKLWTHRLLGESKDAVLSIVLASEYILLSSWEELLKKKPGTCPLRTKPAFPVSSQWGRTCGLGGSFPGYLGSLRPMKAVASNFLISTSIIKINILLLNLKWTLS